LTRHNSHARFIVEALQAGKSVFCEKPLCTNDSELAEILTTYTDLQKQGKTPFLMVGFNRRFAPATRIACNFLGERRKRSVIQMRVNSGYIPASSWVHQPNEGGGRIIGEVCHFVDLASFICGSVPAKVYATSLEDSERLNDNIAINLRMENGAVCNIIYVANGDKSFPREEIQIFAGGAVCVIDNFKLTA
jgi:predicted dehydrogenase